MKFCHQNKRCFEYQNSKNTHISEQASLVSKMIFRRPSCHVFVTVSESTSLGIMLEKLENKAVVLEGIKEPPCVKDQRYGECN